MKKLLSTLMALFVVASFTFAQTPAPAAKDAKAKTEHTKKDGTPDKRFKENKHTKKDGTPDKRFKENKDKKDAAATPVKKAA